MYLCKIILVNSSFQSNPLLWFDGHNLFDNFHNISHFLDWNHHLLPFAKSQCTKPLNGLNENNIMTLLKYLIQTVFDFIDLIITCPVSFPLLLFSLEVSRARMHIWTPSLRTPSLRVFKFQEKIQIFRNTYGPKNLIVSV